MATLDKFLFRITPAPTGNSASTEWRGFLDVEERTIIIFDDATGTEVCRIGGGSGMMELVGGWDASVNTFPIVGSGDTGAVQKGDTYIITVGGTLGGQTVVAGDLLIAAIDAPGQTLGNWAIENHNLGYVPENVANKATSYATVNNTKYPTTAATEARYSHSVFEKIADSGNTGGAPTTLYSTTLVANQFTANGDKIKVTYGGTLTNNADAKVIRASFGGTLILDSTGIDLANIAASFEITFTVIRTGTDTARAIAKLIVSDSLIVVTETDLTGLNWTTTKLVTLVANAAGNDDVIAKLGDGIYIPASS